MCSRRQDQSLNLGESGTPERVLEWGRNKLICPSYLQHVEIREGLEALDEQMEDGSIP